jgi:tRNA(fMet)-specific endonuclease VapC
MTYLLDTDTFSNLVRDHARVELRYSLVGTAATCISTVTVYEIEFGRLLHPERMTRYNSRINALLHEILIAGTALARGLILVTSNTREFCRVDGLQLEDWRDSTLEVREPLHAAHRYKAAARSTTSHPIMG